MIGRNIFCPLLSLQRRVDNREALFVFFEGDMGDAEHFARLVIRHFHRARRRRSSRRRLREGSRTRGAERDVALELLVHGLERDVGEKNDDSSCLSLKRPMTLHKEC